VRPLKFEDKLYWVKFASAFVGGYLASFISRASPTTAGVFLTILFGAAWYALISTVFARAFIPHDVKPSRRQVYLNGLGTYAGSWLMFWILLFNFLG